MENMQKELNVLINAQLNGGLKVKPAQLEQARQIIIDAGGKPRPGMGGYYDIPKKGGSFSLWIS